MSLNGGIPMTFKNLQTIVDEVIDTFSKTMPLIEHPHDQYTTMRYPKMLAFMKFKVNRYTVPRYGNLLTMYTKGLGGIMQLATITFTPNYGTNVPLLLIDVMSMGKKHAVFVEYYDLTGVCKKQPRLMAVAQRYGDLPDYPEKPAWYREERAAYSLIKGGNQDEALLTLIIETIEAYSLVCKEETQQAPDNLIRLAAFVDRMVKEGNPSSATMNRVLGKEQAELFFRKVVMPIEGTDSYSNQ